MTAEYLDRSSLVARMKYYEEHTTEESGEHYAYSVALREIRNAPAADVAEVVHGRWLEEKKQTLLPVEYDDVGKPILHDYVVYRCDRCGRTCKQKEPYCHCGAKMEGGVNE